MVTKYSTMLLNNAALELDITVFPQVKSVQFEFPINIQDLTIHFHKSRQYEIVY